MYILLERGICQPFLWSGFRPLYGDAVFGIRKIPERYIHRDILQKVLQNANTVKNHREAEYDVPFMRGTGAFERFADSGQVDHRRRNFQILLGHGGDDRHHPFRANDLAEAGFDYAAFGHIHKVAQLIPGKW